MTERFKADYLNVYDAFALGGKVEGSCFLEDDVHLTGEGYRQWAMVLEDF